MRAGQLRYQGKILEIPITRDSGGGLVEGTPTTYANVYFGIESTAGSEPFGANRDYSEKTHILLLRYKAGVTPLMKFQANNGPLKDRRLDITAVDESKANIGELRLACKEYRTSATP